MTTLGPKHIPYNYMEPLGKAIGRIGSQASQSCQFKCRNLFGLLYGGFPKLGVPFWGPYNKDYSILGSRMGSPYFGKLPY